MPRPSAVKRRIRHVENGSSRRASDHLAVEEPLEIQLRAGTEQNTVAITMRTPGADFELAAGFLYNEGIVSSKPDIHHMVYCVDGETGQQEYNVLRVQLNRPALPDLHKLDRHFFINSACGVCGRTMIDELADRLLPPLSDTIRVSAQTLAALPQALANSQSLFQSTGGLHAAALFDSEGVLLATREDVGRHNALDKLVGWGVLNNHLPFTDHILLISGRASFELLHKCRVAGVAIFCAVSAPSSLAVDLAHRFDITLIGFLRNQRFNIYTGFKRIVGL